MIDGAELKEVNISGSMIGNFFLNEIEQKFLNGGEDNVEFIYTFPMPENASVSSFFATVGDNRFIGAVKEKEEALKQYQETIARGDSAYMLESHRDNIFQLSLGNVAKGEEVAVSISYVQDIASNDNMFRLLIPTLVSPRYIPGDPSGKKTGTGYHGPTNRVPDADFITPVMGKTGYKANFRIEFDLDSKIKEISSPSHEIDAKFSENKATVTLSQAEMNSDFVLNVSMYGVYSERFISAKKSEGEYFSYISFTPKIEIDGTAKTGKDFIFLVDISGSMSGNNIESAKKAMKICLRNIEAGDSFNIIAFESDFWCFAKNSVEFDESNFAAANEWIDRLSTRGGTEIFKPIKYVAENSKKSSGKEKIMMLATDGQIGNEEEIVGYVQKNFEGRVFCIGIDVNVNDSFLNKLAGIGNGFAEFYYPGSSEDLTKKVVKQFVRANSPYAKWSRFEPKPDVGYEAAGMPPKYIYAGECYSIVLKTDGPIEDFDIIGGKDNSSMNSRLTVLRDDCKADLLCKLWAKKKIAEMEREMAQISPRLEKAGKDRIVALSSRYGVVCRYTSYIALNERTDKQANLPKAAVVPIAAPRQLDKNMFTAPMASGTTKSAVPQLFDIKSKKNPTFMKLQQSIIMDDEDDDVFDDIFTDDEVFDDILTDASFTIAQDFIGQSLGDTGSFPKIQKSGQNPLGANESIDELHKIIGADAEAGEADFKKTIRKMLIEIGSKIETVDFAVKFAKLDKILSAVEKFANKNDKQFDESFFALAERLGESVEAANEKLGLEELACAQNFDGSFFHLKHRNAFSLAALNRFLKEGDIFVYQRQIKKTAQFLKTARLSEAESENFRQCLSLAEELGFPIFA